ncbi:aspartyl protease family protein [Geomonas sp.]|uniref:aspartyl protease family protein n=1 Tax=Geomonas sp. TaxID=2651584 RepID=UPI002B46F065|nr:aspartyl protease family protein [Geomonas sp.]HJV35486.1 aspartyl protease family protein [Geomonas sp.]
MKSFLIIVVFLLFASPLFAEEDKGAEFLRQGSTYFQAQDYQKAVEAFGQAVRFAPKSAQARQGLGMSYLKLGSNETSTNPEMLDNAVKAFKEAASLDPNVAEVRYQLGLTYLLLHDKKGAQVEYDELKRLDAKLAEQLLASIKGYTPPISFRSSATRASAAGNSTRVTIVQNAVLVPVTLSRGGHEVEVTLVLDTGAAMTLINREVAERLEIDLGSARRTVLHGVGGLVRGWHTRLDRVTVGPQSKTGIEVAIVPGGFMFDGLLGMNFLRSFKYSIDFPNQVINWSPL